MGTFIMEDKRYETFALGILAVASNRLTLGRTDNAFKSKFRAMKYQALLELYLSDAKAIPGELQKAVAAAMAAFKVLPSKHVTSKTTKRTVEGKFPLKKIRVASMAGEVRTTSLKRTGSGWCQGVLKQYDPGQKQPMSLNGTWTQKCTKTSTKQIWTYSRTTTKNATKDGCSILSVWGWKFSGLGLRTRQLHGVEN